MAEGTFPNGLFMSSIRMASLDSQLWFGSCRKGPSFDEEANFMSESKPVEEKLFRHCKGLSAESNDQRLKEEELVGDFDKFRKLPFNSSHSFHNK